jgi:phosphonate C-P lyase system protein PhnL
LNKTFKIHTRGSIIDIAIATESKILNLRKSEIAYVSQFLQILPCISAVDVVSEQLIFKGESEAVSRQKAKEMLDYLSIREELFDLFPLTFSGGEQQRVNIAKGIIAPKSLLLLDEPTASLDKKNTMKVVEKLKVLKTQGVAMVGIFHDLEAMEIISDKIYELKRVGYVLINEEFVPADIVIKGEFIQSIDLYGSKEVAVDLGDKKIVPEIVDLHSDAIEKEIEPRHGATFPVELAVAELDKKFSMVRVTTMFHAIGFEENPKKKRSLYLAQHQIEEIHKANEKHLGVDNFIHARFELSATDAVEPIKELSEFPLDLEVAKYAVSKGIATGMDAPNIVRGGSQSGNIAAIELVREGVCKYLCSDYHPTSMLQAVYRMKEDANLPLVRGFSMITSIPASYANISDSSMDDYSYVSEYTQIANTQIGKFANIASNVRINPGFHPYEMPCQHHLLYRKEMYGFGKDDEAFFNYRKTQKVIIGHDVWIGHGAVIMPGIKIGNGAIIGSNAVVTKDVPAFAIVAGVGAKILKYRFPRD